MADDNIWRRGGGSFSSSRSRGRGGRGRRRGNGGSNSSSRGGGRSQDGDGDCYMDEPQERPSRYQPYQNRERRGRSRGGRGESDGGGGDGGRVSAFSRLGNPSRRTGSGGGGGIRPTGGSRDDASRGSWHKVTVLKGGSQSRDWLMRSLKEAVSEPFIAQQTHQLGDKVLFFVEEPRAAAELKSLGKIQSKDGPLNILVKPSGPPKGGSRQSSSAAEGQQFSRRGPRVFGGDDDILMDEDPTQILTQVLGERYKTDTKFLDLSDMFHEQKFQQNKVRASMYDRKFVDSILSLISQHCPDLLGLNLSNNRLQRLDLYSSLPAQLKSLAYLDLSNNDIRSLQELESLQGMTFVTSVSLKGNPCEQYARDFASYSSSVRKYFPSLGILDDQSLPSPVKFDLPVALGKLPPYVQNHLPNDDTKSLIVKFLEQYYTLYDGGSREKLLEAYSDEALFSISILVPEFQRDHGLQVYFSKSRNLRRLKDPLKQDSLLKHGRIDIVQFIRDLPRTKHHSELFEVDVTVATNSQIAFIVHGVFSEEGKREPWVRSFTRTFVVTVTGGSVSILNDLLSVTCASQSTIQFVKENITQASASAGIPPAAIPAVMNASQGMTAQEADVLKLAQATNMNLDFSKRCLMENNWDYSTALAVFSNLQANNQIPPEAFRPQL